MVGKIYQETGFHQNIDAWNQAGSMGLCPENYKVLFCFHTDSLNCKCKGIPQNFSASATSVAHEKECTFCIPHLSL